MSRQRAPWDRRVVLGSSSKDAECNSAIPGVTQGTEKTPKGWHSRGYVPHLDVPGLVQHLTFHLADSLPRSALERMELAVSEEPEGKRAVERRRRIQELLDAGHGGCVLAQPACAEVVQQSLLFGDGERYRLLAWVVMPNHVHVLIEQREGWPLSKVVQSWKRHMAREIHRLGFGRARSDPSSGGPGRVQLGDPGSGGPGRVQLGDPGSGDRGRVQLGDPGQPGAAPALWQRDYWDRYIRNDRHLATVIDYIEQNPVVAGLCDRPVDWPWGSASIAPSNPP